MTIARISDPQRNCSSSSFRRAADSRNYHPGKQVDGKPKTMTTDQAVSQGGYGHHQAAHDATLDAGGNRVNLLGKPEPITRHSGTKLVHRAGLLDDRLGTKRRLDQGSCLCPRPGSSCPIQPPRPKTNSTAPTRDRARLVAKPAPRSVIPSASTIGQAVARGISTLSAIGRDPAGPRSCRSELVIHSRFLLEFNRPQRPTTYTKVKTTTQTPSTKCQYQETTSTPVLFRSVICRRHARPNTMLITITPMVTCKA